MTKRQNEVLSLIARGMSNKQIARVLNIAPDTVRQHAYQLYRALGVHTRKQAAVAYIQQQRGPQ